MVWLRVSKRTGAFHPGGEETATMSDRAISDRRLMELALRAGIQLELARIKKPADLEPIRQLAEALEQASSVSEIETAGRPLSLVDSSMLEPFERLYLFKRARDDSMNIGPYLASAAERFLEIGSLDSAPKDAEDLVSFCRDLHRVLRSYARADREMIYHGRRRHFAGATISRRPTEDLGIQTSG